MEKSNTNTAKAMEKSNTNTAKAMERSNMNTAKALVKLAKEVVSSKYFIVHAIGGGFYITSPITQLRDDDDEVVAECDSMANAELVVKALAKYTGSHFYS